MRRTLPIKRLSDVQSCPVYLVETDHGKLGTEISGDRMDSRESVVERIAGGNHKIIKVLEIVEAEGTCRDVTEDFARAAADLLHANREPVSYELGTWLQQQIDVTVTHSLNFEHAAAE